jgi:hypothetical protein
MTRLRPFLAVLLSLLLLGAQQAAYAHMIGHIGPAISAETTASHNDDEHGHALNLSHVCTTCVSAAGLASAAPSGVPPRLTFDGALEVPSTAIRSGASVAAAQPYLARAPPAVL